MFDLSFIKKSVAGLADQRRQLRSEIETLQRKREDVVNAPATRDDIKAMVDSWCKAKAASYVPQLRVSMESFIRKPGKIGDANLANSRMTMFGATGQIGGIFPGPAQTDAAICAILGAQLVKALHHLIDEMEWPEGALPVAGRDRTVAQLDEKINKLVREEETLVSEARTAGVIFE